MSVEARGDVAPMGRCDTPGMPKLVRMGLTVLLVVVVAVVLYVVTGGTDVVLGPR
jgi:hypothetical protein